MDFESLSYARNARLNATHLEMESYGILNTRKNYIHVDFL